MACGWSSIKLLSSSYSFYLFIYLFIFRAAPAAHGNSPGRGRIRAAAAGRYHSHSNARSKPCLRLYHSSGQRQIPDPLIEASALMETSRIRFPCTTTRTPSSYLLNLKTWTIFSYVVWLSSFFICGLPVTILGQIFLVICLLWVNL